MRELYKNLLETKKIRVDDVPAILKEYLFGERILELPRPIKKALRYHEKTFLKVLRSNVLQRLTPLVIVDGEYIKGGVRISM